MHAVKEKVSDAASSGKKHVEKYKAKAEEEKEKAMARTEGEKVIAHERRKAKEAEADMQYHQEKAEHMEERENARRSHVVGANERRMAPDNVHGQHIPGSAIPAAPTTAATGYPATRQTPSTKYI